MMAGSPAEIVHDAVPPVRGTTLVPPSQANVTFEPGLVMAKVKVPDGTPVPGAVVVAVAVKVID